LVDCVSTLWRREAEYESREALAVALVLTFTLTPMYCMIEAMRLLVASSAAETGSAPAAEPTNQVLVPSGAGVARTQEGICGDVAQEANRAARRTAAREASDRKLIFRIVFVLL
jgi:uncharacterized low-complexity protein